MRPAGFARPFWPPTIRVRLGAALALALLPVLLLGMVEAGLAWQRQAQAEQSGLTAAATRSAAVARARIESAQVLLQTLAPNSTGFECAARLSDVAARLHGFIDLIRFDAQGRYVCASNGAPEDAARTTRPWFQTLASGTPVTVASVPGVAYAQTPYLMAAARAETEQHQFDGALVAVMSLDSLKPDAADPALPPGSEVALLDAQGHWLTATDLSRFPQQPAFRPAQGARLWLQDDRTGGSRLYAAAPLVGDQVFVALSAPSESLFSWAWLNPVVAIALPLLAFVLAVIAVWVVAERGVVRWIAYLQRVAAIYARGRFTVRSVQAERAPPEIHDLAATLDAMADVIVARDAALNEHLAQKDAMLLEIHHRVKNNLQVISSLLSMQQRALADPAARAAISDTRQRIMALALIYRVLYQSPDLRRADLREFLEELVRQLVIGESGQRLADTELTCDSVVIDPDRLAPIGLFAVEAVSNACKHGLETGGDLTIAFRAGGGRGELTITDSGRPGPAPKLGAGVGRTLMTAYARQLRGEATFKANPNGGLTARLAFPIPESLPGAEDGEPERIRALSPEAVR